MNITLKSKVIGDFTEVYKRFDRNLFSYLLPPGAQLIEFGGSKKGDIVHLKLPLAGEWISEITENGISAEVCYFIDEDKNVFTSTLDEDGYEASLNKCLVYFEKKEEFERCTTIKKILKTL